MDVKTGFYACLESADETLVLAVLMPWLLLQKTHYDFVLKKIFFAVVLHKTIRVSYMACSSTVRFILWQCTSRTKIRADRSNPCTDIVSSIFSRWRQSATYFQSVKTSSIVHSFSFCGNSIPQPTLRLCPHYCQCPTDQHRARNTALLLVVGSLF